LRVPQLDPVVLTVYYDCGGVTTTEKEQLSKSLTNFFVYKLSKSLTNMFGWHVLSECVYVSVTQNPGCNKRPLVLLISFAQVRRAGHLL
jgi:hypothetical protein